MISQEEKNDLEEKTSLFLHQANKIINFPQEP